VERWSRYVMLFALPDGNSAEAVRVALSATVQRLPEHLWQSLTWDQGKEMAQHVQFNVDTGIQVYFCDPKSPWQRGSNENTNGLLRQYFPKGTDMAALTQQDLDFAAHRLNGRPWGSIPRSTVRPMWSGCDRGGTGTETTQSYRLTLPPNSYKKLYMQRR